MDLQLDCQSVHMHREALQVICPAQVRTRWAWWGQEQSWSRRQYKRRLNLNVKAFARFIKNSQCDYLKGTVHPIFAIIRLFFYYMAILCRLCLALLYLTLIITKLCPSTTNTVMHLMGTVLHLMGGLFDLCTFGWLSRLVWFYFGTVSVFIRSFVSRPLASVTTSPTLQWTPACSSQNPCHLVYVDASKPKAQILNVCADPSVPAPSSVHGVLSCNRLLPCKDPFDAPPLPPHGGLSPAMKEPPL